MKKSYLFFVVFLLALFTTYLLFNDSISLAPSNNKFSCGQVEISWASLKAGQSAQGNNNVQGFAASSKMAVEAAKDNCGRILASKTQDPKAPFYKGRPVEPSCPGGDTCPETSVNKCEPYFDASLSLHSSDISYDCTSQSVGTPSNPAYKASCTCTAINDILFSISRGCTTCI